MRVECDQRVSQSTTVSSPAASQTSSASFADSLATAVASADSTSDGGGSPPELSASTYRLFAAVSLERGDTEQAARYLAKVPLAREAGLPTLESGVLAEDGRWDYTQAAAALPETGSFDPHTGQGALTFRPFGGANDTETATGCTPATAAEVASAASVNASTPSAEIASAASDGAPATATNAAPAADTTQVASTATTTAAAALQAATATQIASADTATDASTVTLGLLLADLQARV